MRILYYIAYPKRLAGANRGLYELVTNLPDHVEPVVVATGEGMAPEYFKEAGIPVRILPPGSHLNTYGKAVLDWSIAKVGWIILREWIPNTQRLWRTIRELNVDLIHANDPRGTFLIAGAARLAGRPIVSHMQGEIPFGGVLRRIYELLPNRFVAVSEATQRHLHPSAQKRSKKVYYGRRDVSDQGEPLPWLTSLREDGVVVGGCFASVTPFKGYHHLLRALAELNRRGWRNHIVFIGLGDLNTDKPVYVRWVRRLREELNVDNFTFAGWQSDPFSFYQSVDFTVLPSVSEEHLKINGESRHIRGNEGLPLTHLEAMYFSLPIVGTANAGVCEQVEHGVNGLIVPPSDPEALADALEKLLENPEQRRQMGRAGRKRVIKHFSTEAYVRGVVEVYHEVLSS